MGLGSLAVVGDQAPKNLAVLVLDNEKFGETGRQRGLTAGRTDIAAAAKAFGFRETMTVTEQGAAAELARFLFTEPGPVLGRRQDRRHRGPLGVARKRRRHHRPPLPRRAGPGEGLTGGNGLRRA